MLSFVCLVASLSLASISICQVTTDCANLAACRLKGGELCT